ncbi:hypothetical protein [Massilia sp. CF038]|uniref:hypothetical protein n=1 Tax=Massilia sp. CF038 TaxID=1881045 RepID=UPI00116124B9|nr:hypothetical protein [Massilia sp. CF038]
MGTDAAQQAQDGKAWHAAQTAVTWPFMVAFLYLLLPSAIVLACFTRYPILVAGAATAAILWTGWRLGQIPSFNLSALVRTWPYLLLAIILAWMSGAMPPFAENIDWYKHYAIFNALGEQAWPPQFLVADGMATLRYSLAYYVVPALAAKCFGATVLPLAIFAWTTLGCYLSLLLAFDARARSSRAALMLGLIFVLFSGADIVGTYFTGAFPSSPMPSMHIEWWSYFGELPSAVTSLFWTPQHAIAGWLGALLLFRFPHQGVRNAGVIGAAAAIWSPFVAIGLLPLLLWASATTGVRALFSRSNMIAAPVLLVLGALFLTQGAGGIPFGFVWNAPDVIWYKHAFSPVVWVLFVLLEFLLLACALVLLRPASKGIVAILCSFMLLLSVFSGGAYNDLLMRASIPSLAVLALLCAQALVCAAHSWRTIPLVLLLLAGLATPYGEMQRAVRGSRIKDAAAISMQDVLSQNPALQAQYVLPANIAVTVLPPVLDETRLTFTTFGNADFDVAGRRVGSATYTDAALVSQTVDLPAGYYQMRATLDWEVAAAEPVQHAAHISLHGKVMVLAIPTSQAHNKTIVKYFYWKGGATSISFGLGGWSSGKGAITLKQLRFSPALPPAARR